MGYPCPQCRGNETRKFSVVFEEGFSQIRTKTRGIGIGTAGLLRPRLGLGFGSARTKGVQQSQLSRTTAPPPKASYATPFKWGAAGLVVIALFVSQVQAPGGLAVLLLLVDGATVVWGLKQQATYNATVWPPLYAQWDLQFLCTQCGHQFVPGESPLSVSPPAA